MNAHGSKLNVGIIGSGSAAKLFASAVKSAQGFDLWSFFSRDLRLSTQLSSDFGGRAKVSAHDSLDAMLADPDLHVVIVASPDSLHHPHVLAAARAKKHVMVEKPMATELAHADEMIAVCHENQVCLSVGYRARWHGGHQWVAQRLHEGAFGKLRHVHSSWSYRDIDRSNWRYSGKFGPWAALSKLGTHLVDFNLWMGDGEGDVDQLRSVIVRSGPNDESAVVSWKFTSKATADLYTSVAFGDGESRVEIHCDNALITMENTFSFAAGGKILINGEPLAFPVVLEFEEELQDLGRAIRSRQAPSVGGVIGRRNVDVLLQAIKENA